MSNEQERPDFIINVRKPIGWSSNDVIRYIKNKVRPFKVGHAGTLDPFADGVLIVCVGKATKRVAGLMDAEKEYVTELCLGIETDTLDVSGNVVNTGPFCVIDENAIQAVKKQFTGQIIQKPPAFSALKFNGRRAYEVARNGGTVELKDRTVFIQNLDIEKKSENVLLLKVTCSKGTYIRTLATDIAHELGTMGYLQKLSRVRVGTFDIKDAVLMEQLGEYLDIKLSNWN